MIPFFDARREVAAMTSLWNKHILVSLVFLLVAVTSLSCTGSTDEDVLERDNLPFVLKDGEFKKVDRPFPTRDLVSEANSVDRDQFSSGRLFQKAGRRHMVPNVSHNQFALHEHEAFVLDLAYLPFNFLVRDFEVTILANFRPIPFHIYSLADDEPFPDMNADKSDVVIGPTDTSSSLRIESEDGQLNTYTVVIPPRSFESKGAIDLRVVMTPLRNAESAAELTQLRDPNLSVSLTVYRAGSEFPSIEDLGISESSPEQLRPTRHLMAVMSLGFERSALLPDEQTLELERDLQHYDLIQDFPLSTNHELFAAYYVDYKWDAPQRVLSNFRVNGEYLDEWEHALVNPIPSGGIGEEDTASVRRLGLNEASMKDSVNTAEFVVFERPLQDQHDVDEFRQLVEQSNVLHFVR